MKVECIFYGWKMLGTTETICSCYFRKVKEYWGIGNKVGGRLRLALSN